MKIIRVVSLVAIVALASGCQVLAPQIDKTAKAAGKAVTFYCNNVTSQEIREEFRGLVNAAAAPNSVVVTCANGNATLKTSGAL